MERIEYWIANDGKRFDDEDECQRYEVSCAFNAIKDDFKAYGEDGKELPMPVDMVPDIDKAYYLKVETDEAANVISDYSYDQGFDIDCREAGLYYWDCASECWCNLEDEKKRIKEIEDFLK
jgi:hypothetical protein